ncbi:MAG: hypothetical protein SGPRY_005880 [Prymnesium sp.]
MASKSLLDDLRRAVGSDGRVNATCERSQFRTSLPAAVKRMEAALTDSVQQHLFELPASDESEFVKETRQLLGASAPTKDSLDELREAWHLMRAALLMALLPLGILSATDVGLAKLDARVGATATSTHDVGARFLAAWLRRDSGSSAERGRRLGVRETTVKLKQEEGARLLVVVLCKP